MNPPINLADLETIITSLIAEGKCACHFINPHKTRILMWRIKPEVFHLRIGIQKFVSSEQKDRQGETYWRYYAYEIEPTNLNSITPEKEYDKSNPKPSVNSSSV